MNRPTAPRYAIYFAPAAGSPWWNFGAHWLGRDECLDRPLAPPVFPDMPAPELARLTAQPRRYGFHATLKAPFRLQPGLDAPALLARVQALALTRQPVPLGTLAPVFMDGFVALVPAATNTAIQQLAQACVTDLDDLRMPLDAADRARRRPEALDDRGRELLERFGYPYVLERFRFHMTLTGPVDTTLAGRVIDQLAPRVAQLQAQSPPVLDRLCVFVEPEPGAPFLRLAEASLCA